MNPTFPPIYTVWVVRSGIPYYIYTATSFEAANNYGNNHISDKQFVIRVYRPEEVPEEVTSVPSVTQVSSETEINPSRLSWTTDSSAIEPGMI